MFDKTYVISKGDIFYSSEIGHYGFYYRSEAPLVCQDTVEISSLLTKEFDRINNEGFYTYMVSEGFAKAHGLTNTVIWVHV